MGASLYGFSAELKNGIVNNISDLNNLAGRAGDGLGFIDNDSVKGHAWFQALSKPVQQVYLTLTEVTAGASSNAWVSLLEAAFPTISKAVAANPRKSLRFILVSSLFGPESAGLQGNLNYKPEYDLYQNVKADQESKLATLKGDLKALEQRGENTRTVRRQITTAEKKLRGLAQKHPRAILFTNAQKNKEVLDQITLFASELAEEGADIRQKTSAFTGKYGGAMNILVALMNVANTADFISESGKSVENKDDVIPLAYNLSYTFNAVAALYQAGAENRLQKLAGSSLGATTVDGGKLRVIDKASSFWSNPNNTTLKPDQRAAWVKNIHNFSAKTAVMGAFGLVAVGLEGWAIFNKLGEASTKQENTLQWMQIGGLTLQGAGFLAQLVVGTTARFGLSSVAFLLGPWVSGAIFVGGLAYMVASFAINYFKKNAMQLWLRRTPWGKEPVWEKDIDHLREAWVSLQELMLKPVVYVQKTSSISGYRYSHAAGQNIPEFNTSGYWLKIAFPPQLAGQTVNAKIATIDSRGWLTDTKRQYDYCDEWHTGSWTKTAIEQFVVAM